MQGQNVIRTLLFVVFFSIGAAAMGGSVLCDDLVSHYRNKHFREQAKRLNQRRGSLIADYEALLRQLEDDPNLIKRIAPTAIGADQNEPNTIYPRATAQELAAARKALAQIAEQEPNEPVLPAWLARCSEPRLKTYLFICGAALILISFVCFARIKTPDDEQ
jgi:uncharacterized membrane protein YccC